MILWVWGKWPNLQVHTWGRAMSSTVAEPGAGAHWAKGDDTGRSHLQSHNLHQLDVSWTQECSSVAQLPRDAQQYLICSQRNPLENQNWD